MLNDYGRLPVPMVDLRGLGLTDPISLFDGERAPGCGNRNSFDRTHHDPWSVGRHLHAPGRRHKPDLHPRRRRGARRDDRWPATRRLERDFPGDDSGDERHWLLLSRRQLRRAEVIGGISLAALAVALFALYGRSLAGFWRATYVASAMLALYLNVFVAIVQAFQKLSFLEAVAPPAIRSAVPRAAIHSARR